MKNILEAKNLKTIRGGSLLVDVPGIGILEGETLSIIGPNGAGKTTLLQALSFLMNPLRERSFSGGRLWVQGSAYWNTAAGLPWSSRSRCFSTRPSSAT
jgi:ABC-type cobalamin/Fe3+-siderophores transport system ATPase subunit